MLNISRNVKETTNPPIVTLTDIAHTLKKEGKDVISMCQAVPDLPVQTNLLDSAKEALGDKFINAYSSDMGLIELRHVLAKKLLVRNGIKANPEKEILVTAGANQAALAAFLTILDSDDEVIIPSPYYFNHEMGVRIAGGRPVECRMVEGSDGFSIDVNALRKQITKRTKAITLVTPNNPTGAVFDKDTLEEIASIALKNGLFIIADETYEKFLFDNRKHFSIGSIERLKENVITIFSFSKTYSITGWRLGYLVANAKIIEEMMKVHDTMIICAPVISQTIGIKAIEEDIVMPDGNPRLNDFIHELERRRDAMKNRVNGSSHFKWREPHGALFAFIEYRNHDILSEQLAFDLLQKVNVVVMPGSSFGKCGEYHLRVSFGSVSIDRMEEAFDRLDEYFTS
ncbi:MAG: pyridoxal phosphate-dependent aminotransferase [Candidatus Anammoxibacter sp.]